MRRPIPHCSRISAAFRGKLISVAALIRVNVYCLQHRQDNILNFKKQRTHAHSVFVKAFPACWHFRPQSPSFLGHVVTKGSLQIKPSGSGDENGPFASDTSPKWIDREGRKNAVQGLGKVFLRRQSHSEELALFSGPLRKQKVMVCDLWLVDFDPFCVFLGSLLLNFRVRSAQILIERETSGCEAGCVLFLQWLHTHFLELTLMKIYFLVKKGKGCS